MYLDWRPTTMTTVQRRWESQPSCAYISMVAHAKSVSRQNVKPNKQTKIQATIIHFAFIHASLWLKDVAENTNTNTITMVLLSQPRSFVRLHDQQNALQNAQVQENLTHSTHTHTLALVHTSTERKETYGILWANENNKPNIKYPCEHVHTKHRKHTAEWEKTG